MLSVCGYLSYPRFMNIFTPWDLFVLFKLCIFMGFYAFVCICVDCILDFSAFSFWVIETLVFPFVSSVLYLICEPLDLF